MISIYGASDDLVEVEGDVSEEFNHYDSEEEPCYLAFSDGTLLKVQYLEGVWRIFLMAKGRCNSKLEQCMSKDGSDHAYLTGEKVTWVVCGKFAALKK
jgi:hypothetical protein